MMGGSHEFWFGRLNVPDQSDGMMTSQLINDFGELPKIVGQPGHTEEFNSINNDITDAISKFSNLSS